MRFVRPPPSVWIAMLASPLIVIGITWIVPPDFRAIVAFLAGVGAQFVCSVAYQRWRDRQRVASGLQIQVTYQQQLDDGTLGPYRVATVDLPEGAVIATPPRRDGGFDA